MGLDGTLYKTLLVLHIMAAIVGFGAVFLNGLYAAETKKRQGPSGRAVLEANIAVSSVAEKLIYAVPLLGILLVLVSDEAWSFSDTWIWLSMALFVVGIGVSHSVVIPGAKRINALLLEIETGPPPTGGPPPQVAVIEALGKRQAIGGGFLDLLLVALVALMVFKP
ncbi:MAG: hypothetical protein QOF97_413 [Acidimicrobiaceae bacterium]